MNLLRIKIKGAKLSPKRLLFALGERAFLVFLGLFAVTLIFGAIIYYQYNILAKKKEVQIIKQPLQFQEKIYQNVFRIWQERERSFKEASPKEHVNPFKVERFQGFAPEEPPDSSGGEQESDLEEDLNSIEAGPPEEDNLEEPPSIDQE